MCLQAMMMLMKHFAQHSLYVCGHLQSSCQHTDAASTGGQREGAPSCCAWPPRLRRPRQTAAVGWWTGGACSTPDWRWPPRQRSSPPCQQTLAWWCLAIGRRWTYQWTQASSCWTSGSLTRSMVRTNNWTLVYVSPGSSARRLGSARRLNVVWLCAPFACASCAHTLPLPGRLKQSHPSHALDLLLEASKEGSCPAQLFCMEQLLPVVAPAQALACVRGRMSRRATIFAPAKK